MKWVGVMQWHPEQVIVESAWIPTGLFLCRALSLGTTPNRLTQACSMHSLGSASNQTAFVAVFAFLLVKQSLLSAAEEFAERCLIKLILPLLIIPKLQYFPSGIIYNFLF